MTYRSRPVWEFDINRTDEPAQRFEYELNSTQVGYGWPRLSPNQLHVTQGWTCTLSLWTEADVAEVDAFLDDVRGPLRGWWFPDPQELGAIVEGVGLDMVRLSDSRLAETWDQHPAVVVIFTKPGELSQIAEIEAVTADDGSEVVTLESELSSPVDSTWTMRRLHYVRLNGDAEEGTVDAEGCLTRSINVVELPTEYADQETGVVPVYLYEFTAVAGEVTRTWRLTSYWETINSGGNDFAPAPINHGSLTRTTKADAEQVTLEAVYEADGPLAQFLPNALPVPLQVVIYAATLAHPDDVYPVFSGLVDDPQINGHKISARCQSYLDAMTRKVPSMQIQGRCPYQTYDGATCKLDKGDWGQTGEILSINGRVIQVAPEEVLDDDWFGWGWVEFGSGATYEVRTIMMDLRLAPSNNRELTLNAPLNHATVGANIALYPGDDHRLETCENKFNNLVNFGGIPWVPGDNLSIQAITSTPDTGGKK